MKKITLYVLFLLVCASPVYADVYGVQEAWNNPSANMSAGSSKPGYAQMTWTPGAVLPIKLRNGMVTMINLPEGEVIEDGIVGSKGLFDFKSQKGGRSMFVNPLPSNQGSDTNLIVTGKSGNKYIFYLRSEPANASEITYSMVDVVLDGNNSLPVASGNTATAAGMDSIFQKADTSASTLGTDGEDYGWIKTMKIDPSEFRFDLDIFVPNPDDYVIAPERVWRDRIFTYIDFGDKVIAMTQRPVVSLLIEGGESPVGFRTDGENGRLLIVEAVGDMVLRSGQRIVCIKKREKPFLIADTSSVMALAEANVTSSMYSGQSLNNVAYYGTPVMTSSNGYGVSPTMNYGTLPADTGYTSGGATSGVNMLPTTRNTAGAFLPQSDIPLISSNQQGVAVELKSGTDVKALDDYWNKLLSKFSGEEGRGILTPYKDMVFFSIDAAGVGDLGSAATTSRLYRLRVGPLADIDTAQKLCDSLLKFQGTSCHVVRVQ